MKKTLVLLISIASFSIPVSVLADETMKLMAGGAAGEGAITLVVPKKGKWNSQTAVLTNYSSRTQPVNVMPTYHTGDEKGTNYRTQLAAFARTDEKSIDIRPSPIAASLNIMTFTRKKLTGGLTYGVCRVFRTPKDDGETLDRFVILTVSGTTAENRETVMKELVQMLGETKIEGQ